MILICQFVGSSELSSRLIEFKGSGPYSHVDFVLPNGNLFGARSDIILDIPPGVQERPPNYEPWERIDRIEVPDCNPAAFDFLLAQRGKPYDTAAIAGFIFGRDWRKDEAWICSELEIAVLEKADVFIYPLAVPANKIDPNMAFALTSTVGCARFIR